jgi:hypothetical protein
VAVALLIYSQTAAFAWDEGFHLLAGQLILKGKKPYADFLFAQPPLNALWNAAIIRVFGNSWRWPHAASALETLGAVTLMTDYVARRFPALEWRIPLAAMTAVVFGFNTAVFGYGPLAQPYGLCLLFTVAAFRLAVTQSVKAAPALASGIASGAACAASLLTAPVLPVLAVWIGWNSRGWRRPLAFMAGALAGLSPLIAALARWPRQTFFGVIAFHLFHRQTQWENWPSHDAGVLTAWLGSAQTFTLIVLAVVGAVSLRRCAWERSVKAEFGLVVAVAGALCLFLACGHPTFNQYFLLAVPFASVLAAAGLYALARSHSPPWAAALVICVTAAGLARSLIDDRDSGTWADFPPIVKAVEAVTPNGASLYADEQVYFLSGYAPPSGMEWTSGHKIEMPLANAKGLHLIPQSELDRLVGGRFFATIETCEEVDVDRLRIDAIYANKKRVGDCFVFW